MTSHIRKWKEAKKEEIKKLAEEYPVIAIATLNQLPANILSVLRKKLSSDTKILVAKTRVIQKAFTESNINTEKIDPSIKESIIILFTKKNPFELYSFIKNNKGNTTAKEGDITEKDIIIQAGDSGLPPGPALSTLKGVGLKVQVQGPTISITADKLVAKKGDEITSQLADVLSKLNMKPIKIGMKIIGILDKTDNVFYKEEVLNVDEEELFNKFVTAYQQALNLSVNANYFNDDSSELIIIKAEREARAVNESLRIETKKDVEQQEVVEKKDDSEEKKIQEDVTEQVLEETKNDEIVEQVLEDTKKED